MSENSRRSQPYVGVSGVVRLEKRQPSGLVVTEPQQLFIEAAAQNTGLFGTGRRLALGVKATHSTQWLDLPQSRHGVEYGPEWYPVGPDQFRDALSHKSKNPNTLNVVQLYFDKRQVHDSGYRSMFLARTAWRARKWAEAVQFDSYPWQENERLFQALEFTKERLGLQTILQCHEAAMDDLGPDGVVKVLGRHAAQLDYLLLDTSHGRGIELDANALDPYLEEIYSSDALGHIGVGVAGGLDAKAVRDTLPQLLQKYPDLSWDAEARLHPRNNVGKRPLQMDMTKEYLRESANVIQASDRALKNPT